MRRGGLLLLVLWRRVRFGALLLRWLVRVMRVGLRSHRPTGGHASLGPGTLAVVLRRSRKRVLGVGLLLLRVGGDHGGGATACAS